MPIERGSKYEDPLDAVLKKSNLGEVTGGGSLQAANGEIKWVGVDIEVTDIHKAIPLITKTFREIGAPRGSRLEYKINGNEVVTPIHDP
ncbi:hypothetical protein C0V76_07005 [Uliginosibacterium sp. TH139]|nr:hypothetical protein C0V76_07005 [Uliginosibacterium sp. TH139]